MWLGMPPPCSLTAETLAVIRVTGIIGGNSPPHHRSSSRRRGRRPPTPPAPCVMDEAVSRVSALRAKRTNSLQARGSGASTHPMASAPSSRVGMRPGSARCRSVPPPTPPPLGPAVAGVVPRRAPPDDVGGGREYNGRSTGAHRSRTSLDDGSGDGYVGSLSSGRLDAPKLMFTNDGRAATAASAGCTYVGPPTVKLHFCVGPHGTNSHSVSAQWCETTHLL